MNFQFSTPKQKLRFATGQVFKLLIIILLGLIPVGSARAQVVINEIAWMGTASSVNDEWLELYNLGWSSVNLDGWLLRAVDGSPEITLTGMLPGQSFFLLERTDDTTVPGISADQIYTGALKNSGEHLELLDSQGNLIDSVNCSSGWFAGDNVSKQTMERKNAEAAGNNESNWGTSQNPEGTPRTKNSISGTVQFPRLPEPLPRPQPEPNPQLEPANQFLTTTSDRTEEPEIKADEEQKERDSLMLVSKPAPAPEEPKPVTYASGIIINEILPSPEGADETEEWIELKNLNKEEVNLSGWKIQDTAGSLTTYTFPAGTKIGPNSFLVLPRPTTKIALNNSGDGLELLQPNGNILDKAIYVQAGLGQSFNRFGQDWQWSNVLTPGRDNVLPPARELEEISKKETSSENGSSTIVQGLENSPSQLAALREQMPRPSGLLLVCLTASAIAVFSGITMVVLKKTLKTKH